MSLDDLWNSFMYGDGKPPEASGLLLCAPIEFAIYNAAREFHGRDWRRIKRETRKAELKARRENPIGGINRSVNPFWNRVAQ